MSSNDKRNDRHPSRCNNFAIDRIVETIEQHFSNELDDRREELLKLITSLEGSKKVVASNAFGDTFGDGAASILDQDVFEILFKNVFDGLEAVKKDLQALSDYADDAADKKLAAIKQEMIDGVWDEEMEEYGIDTSKKIEFTGENAVVLFGNEFMC